jgi:hypothetical protein
MLVGELSEVQTQKNSSLSLTMPGVLPISLMASMCCKSHEGSLSFMASDSEPKNFFIIQMLVGEF